MKPKKIAFAGAGGYANYCLDLLLNYIPKEEYQLVGIADPFVKMAPKYNWFCEQQIPMYDTIEEMLEQQNPEMVYIASPIPMHKPQVLAALAHGADVMCEKPLTPFLRDAKKMEDAAQTAGKLLGIGFQWSFAEAMLKAKQDILNGEYGKPVCLKAYISWQRFDDYYRSSWKGRKKDADGNWVFDSIVTNATAHYLHNICFMMGNSLERSRMPEKVSASIYRGKEIESFDSCFAKGSFDNGAEFLFLATHSGDQNLEPMIEYQFEHGVITADMNSGSPILKGIFDNGTVREYGLLNCPDSDSNKIRAFFDAAEGKQKLTCTVETVLPHLKVCGAMFDQLPILEFPQQLRYRSEEPAGSFVRGLSEQLLNCFRQGKTPYDMGLNWANEEQLLDLEREFYRE